MELSKIHHVAIIVSDYEAAREFYVEKLGFRVKRENYRPERGDWKLDKAIKNNVPSNEFVEFLDEAFGLKLAESTPDISDELKAKIAERKQAKTERDFAKSDALRDEIAKAGIKLLDGANEMLWQYE